MTLSIRVADADWGDQPTNIHSVVTSIATCFSDAIDERPGVPPLVVEKSTLATPIALFQLSDAGETRIALNLQGPYWAQCGFQFAHELCHVLANYRPPQVHKSKWIEEALCEASSLFALDRVARRWAKSPVAHQVTYAPEFRAFRQDRWDDPEHQLPPGVEFTDWLAQFLPSLQATPHQEHPIAIVARQLLPVFDHNPDAWRAIRYLNTWDASGDSSVSEFWCNWRNAVPDRLRQFTDRLEDRLRSTLKYNTECQRT